jgi:hypothetical protein
MKQQLASGQCYTPYDTNHAPYTERTCPLVGSIGSCLKRSIFEDEFVQVRNQTWQGTVRGETAEPVSTARGTIGTKPSIHTKDCHGWAFEIGSNAPLMGIEEGGNGEVISSSTRLRFYISLVP